MLMLPLDMYFVHTSPGETYRSMSALIGPSALAYAAPLPSTTRGALASLIVFATSINLRSDGTDIGASVKRNSFGLPMSYDPRIKFAGRSTYAGPGRPKYAARYASLINLGIMSADGGRTASFACGVRSEMASTSWKASLPALCVSVAPLNTNSGHELAAA